MSDEFCLKMRHKPKENLKYSINEENALIKGLGVKSLAMNSLQVVTGGRLQRELSRVCLATSTFIFA